MNVTTRFEFPPALRIFILGSTALALYYLIPLIARTAALPAANLVALRDFDPYRLAFEVLEPVFTIALALLASMFMPGRLTGFAWGGRISVLDSLAGIIIGLAGFILPVLPFLLLDKAAVQNNDYANLLGLVGLSTIMFSLQGAILSELVFRSWLYNPIRKAFGRAWAIIVVMLIFVPLYNGLGSLGASLLFVLLLTICREKTQKLWLSAGISFASHFVSYASIAVIPMDYVPKISGVEISWLVFSVFSMLFTTWLVSGLFVIRDQLTEPPASDDMDAAAEPAPQE